jgi:hypothetical protein
MSNRRFVTKRRIEARDRRMAAIHEAGHVTMARHVGLETFPASLERIPDASISVPYDKFWIGKTPYLTPESIGRELSDTKLAMFGVAGAVAERCWDAESFEDDEDFWDDRSQTGRSVDVSRENLHLNFWM